MGIGNELQQVEDVAARLRALIVHLDGTATSPGVIQLLDGVEGKEGLIGQAYHTATLLQALLDRREAAADLFEPGEVQDKKIELVANRLGAAISTEASKVSKPVVESIEAASQEVLISLRRTRDEVQELIASAEKVEQSLIEPFDQLQLRVEGLSEQFLQISEYLDRLSTFDYRALNEEVKSATEETFRTAVSAFREADKKWLVEMVAKADSALSGRMKDAIEGQNVLFEEQIIRSRQELAKAVEASTYKELLDIYQKKIAELKGEQVSLLAELEAQSAPGRKAGFGPVGFVAIGVSIGLVSASVLFIGGNRLSSALLALF